MSTRVLPIFFGGFCLAAFASSGCLTDVGECDEVAARQIVFLDTGTNVDGDNGEPMYAGQALLDSTCGDGQFCHADAAKGPARFGVPRGFDFDFGLICTDGPCNAFDPATDRLRNSQKEVLSHARLVLDVVRSGSMPPGPVGQVVTERAPSFRIVPFSSGALYSLRTHCPIPTGTCVLDDEERSIPNPELARLGTPEGNEILRNWIACGAPVIESTDEPGAYTTGADCSIAGEQGHTGSCVARIPAPITVPLQRWSSLFEMVGDELVETKGIYSALIGPRCGTSCHSESDPNFSSHNLDLSNELAAYFNLINRETRGQECGGMGLPLIDAGDREASPPIPGDPQNSIFFHKIARTPDLCGDPMPPGTSSIDSEVTEAIRLWIIANATYE